MGESTQPIDGWRDVAAAMPGAVGLQVDGRFVYASAELASLFGREPADLTDRSWQTLFEGRALDRIERGVETARTEGRWVGEIEASGQSTLEITLSAAEKFVLWICSEECDTTAEMRGLQRSGSQFMKQVLDHLNDTVYIIAEDGRSWFWNDQLAETTGYSHEEIAGMHPKEFIPEDQHDYVPGLRKEIPDTDDRRVELDILSKDGERIPHEFSGATVRDPNTGESFRCGAARNISGRLERERQLERQLTELATLNRINDLLFETARELIRTGSRAAVERIVCERLSSSELYRSAWIGERHLDDECIVERISTGTADLPETVPLTGDVDGRPVARAIDAGTVQVMDRSEITAIPWDMSGDTSPESLVTVPLQHGETVYGVLAVGTDRTDAFTPQEQASFELLGRLIGVVVHAARSRELLFTDAVAELEFDFSGSDSSFVEVASALDCQLLLDGYVPAQEGWVVYLTVEAVQPATAVDRFVASDRVGAGRCISSEGDTGRLEVRMTDLSVLKVVTDAGATVQRASATPETARFVIEAPVDVDLRQLVTTVTDAFPAATLVSTRNRDREITTVGRPGGILDDLTERQREVLEAAYQAGYFDWPRESTAEEVAESLGLASPTLHGHLRKAEHVILSEFLDGV